MKISDILLGLGVFVLLISLMLTFINGISNNYSISYQSQTFQNLNNTISQYKNESQASVNSIQELISSSNSTSITDNPFTTLATGIFGIIPLILNTITYIPNLLINMLIALPLPVPVEIIQFIIYGVYIIIIFLVVNWIRGGIIQL